MLSHSYYEEDPRVRREAEALVAGGRPVDVFALRRPGDPADDVIAGVRVHRLDVQRHQGAGLGVYLREYLSFLFRSGWAVTRWHRRRRYAVLQIHTLPDFLAFAGMPLRLAGVPIILDLHEAMPEFFQARFPRASNPLLQRLLAIQERASIGLASAAITVNDALRDRLVGLGVPAAKVTVILNSPSLQLFDAEAHPRRVFAADGVVRLIYAGALTPTYEVEVAVAAVGRLAELRPELAVHLDIFGRDYNEPPMASSVAALGLTDRVTFHGRVPLETIPAAIAAADIGLAPTRRNPFTDYSLSTKILEYGAMGKPVVASRLPMIERTFPDGTVATYEPGNADDMADRILELVDDAAGRESRVAGTAERVLELGWDQESVRYRAIVDRLARRRDAAASADDPGP